MNNKEATLIVFIDRKDKSKEIEKIDICSSVIRIKFFNNSKIYTYSPDRVKVKTNYYEAPKAKNIMKYFAAEAVASPIKLENQSISLLKKYIDRIVQITDDMVLSYYISSKPLILSAFDTKKLIYPFGINISQKKAVENAFCSPISIIQGPPGTGKTQTILNIIANAIVQNKSIAVVSNNNSAVANIEEKLKKYDLDFLVAMLGSKQNKENFIANPKIYPDLTDFQSEQRNTDLLSQISAILASIEKILEYQNKIAQLKQTTKEAETEYTYFRKEYSFSCDDRLLSRCLCSFSSDKVFKIWSYCTNLQKTKCTFSSFLYFFFRFGIRYLFFKNKNIFVQTLYLQDFYYQNKISELKQTIAKLDDFLGKNRLQDKINMLSQTSLVTLKNILYHRLKDRKRQTFTLSNISFISEEFLEEYPVILSTLFSLKNICKEGFVFDYLVVDEASQADLLTSVIAMSCAKNIIIVGDTKQLPNVITKEVEENSKRILQQIKVDEAYQFHKNSLLSSILTLYPNVPNVLLKEHYRCDPKIIGFCNSKFYQNDLILLPRSSDDTDTLKAIQTSPGNHARGHINQRQIDIIKKEVLPYLGSNTSIGIITPYRDQVEELKKNLSPDIEIDTIHKFQGREKDIIIFSTVDNKISDFIDNPNLINVAVSRAVKKFWIVYSNEDNKFNSNLMDLINYIKYNNFEVCVSSVHSIFDLLYKRYTDERISFLQKHRHISRFASENIAYACIKECLSKISNSTLGVIFGLPLKNLVQISDVYTDEEIIFIRRSSHIDFLIYDKMNKQPILAIEVNGNSHRDDPKQVQRDAIKERILKKAELALLVLSTTGSDEATLITDKIMSELQNIAVSS